MVNPSDATRLWKQPAAGTLVYESSLGGDIRPGASAIEFKIRAALKRPPTRQANVFFVSEVETGRSAELWRRFDSAVFRPVLELKACTA
jgi:hypothetical protein